MLSSLAALALMGGFTSVSGQKIPYMSAPPGWPAATAALSNASWSLIGHQPDRLESWGRQADGSPAPCWKVVVLHDKNTMSWPGTCQGLFQVPSADTWDKCMNVCYNHVQCSVWQWDVQTSPGQCWVGFGYDCGMTRTDIQVGGAQRVMHGSVMVMMNLTGWQVLGLWNNNDDDIYGQDAGIKRCQAWCYSSLQCQYWQYGQGGCWVDAPMYTTNKGQNLNSMVQYPLTTPAGITNIGAIAQSMIAGEYVMHYCPPDPRLRAPVNEGVVLTDSAANQRGVSVGTVIMSIIAAIAIIALCCWGFYLVKQKGAEKNKRAVALEPDGYDEDEVQSARQYDHCQESPVQATYEDYPPPSPSPGHQSTFRFQDKLGLEASLHQPAPQIHFEAKSFARAAETVPALGVRNKQNAYVTTYVSPQRPVQPIQMVQGPQVAQGTRYVQNAPIYMEPQQVQSYQVGLAPRLM